MAAWRQKHRDQGMLEERRKEAVRILLHQRDDEGNPLTQSDVAGMFRVTPGAVSRWLDSYRRAEDSITGLDSGAHTGRPPEMTSQSKRRLVRMLLGGASHYGYETDIWTTERVAKLIRDEFHVEYHPDHVGRILHSLNLSWHKPQGAARERDEEKVKSWVRNVVPHIKKAEGDERDPPARR
ncbi:MAG: winged helix-turn-helix domain-containing protein [Nitrososphaerota archaeon]|nr:winged helix-turn-helix domain-containing protein [Nitrososphaerota archaeon]